LLFACRTVDKLINDRFVSKRMKLIINHKYDARLYVIQIEDFNGLLTATALSLKEKKR